LNMATANPARLFPDMGGVLAEGRAADLIRFRLGPERVEVLEAYLGGELAYRTG
jgi:adenine deaminase